MSDFDDAYSMGLVDSEGTATDLGWDDNTDGVQKHYSVRSDSVFTYLDVFLTPANLLRSDERYARTNLYKEYDTKTYLELLHDRGNEYDSKALEVYYNGTFIGHIMKIFKDENIDNTRVVNNFCFDENRLNNIELFWSGEKFFLKKQTEEQLVRAKEKTAQQEKQKSLLKKSLSYLEAIKTEMEIILEKRAMVTSAGDYSTEEMPIYKNMYPGIFLADFFRGGADFTNDELSTLFPNRGKIERDINGRSLSIFETPLLKNEKSMLEKYLIEINDFTDTFIYKSAMSSDELEVFKKLANESKLYIKKIYLNFEFRVKKEEQDRLSFRANKRGITVEELLKVEKKEEKEWKVQYKKKKNREK